MKLTTNRLCRSFRMAWQLWAVLFLAGHPDPLSPPFPTAAPAAATLAVHIGAGSPAGRTALPPAADDESGPGEAVKVSVGGKEY
jgi:hypothetical protein